MKKFFYILGAVLFSACVFVSCQTSLLNKVNNNLSEISQTIFSGKSENFYATLTSGKREEPYNLDGISRKKVDFSVVSINFFLALDSPTLEFEITIKDKTTKHIAEKSMVTNSYLFDLEKKLLPETAVEISVLNTKTVLSCKSNDFAVDYNKAVEIGTEHLQKKLDLILNKNGSFEVFLKLATAPNSFDDVFVWYYILQSDIGIGAIAIVDCMEESVYSL